MTSEQVLASKPQGTYVYIYVYVIEVNIYIKDSNRTIHKYILTCTYASKGAKYNLGDRAQLCCFTKSVPLICTSINHTHTLEMIKLTKRTKLNM